MTKTSDNVDIDESVQVGWNYTLDREIFTKSVYPRNNVTWDVGSAANIYAYMYANNIYTSSADNYAVLRLNATTFPASVNDVTVNIAVTPTAGPYDAGLNEVKFPSNGVYIMTAYFDSTPNDLQNTVTFMYVFKGMIKLNNVSVVENEHYISQTGTWTAEGKATITAILIIDNYTTDRAKIVKRCEDEVVDLKVFGFVARVFSY